MSLAERRTAQPLSNLHLPPPNPQVGALGLNSPALHSPGQSTEHTRLLSPSLSSPHRHSLSPTVRERPQSSTSLSPFASSSSSNSSQSPGLSDETLSEFRQRCVEFYYDSNPLSGKAVENTMRDVAPLQRKTLNTIQSSVRAQFHTDATHRKRLQLQHILQETQPGALVASALGISVASGIDSWRSQAARKNRHDRLAEFVVLYARRDYPGPQPFLRTLKAILLLQSLSQKHGGAGACRIEWEVDDAVWMEGGGEDFARRGIELLKGVLGFEEMAKEEIESDMLSRQTSVASTASEVTQIHQPFDRRPPPPPVPPPRGSSMTAHRQVAHPSPLSANPFTDSSTATTSASIFSSADLPALAPFGQPPPRSAFKAEPQVPRARLYRRVFVAPAYLTNPELAALSAALPHWLRESARFPTRAIDPEQAVVPTQVPRGHGAVRLSLRPRDAGSGGTLSVLSGCKPSPLTSAISLTPSPSYTLYTQTREIQDLAH